MAIVKAFNGIRYSKENITNEICPPYDVISPEEKAQLKKKSKHNMVQLELSDAAEQEINMPRQVFYLKNG